jgi:hypothetical protein
VRGAAGASGREDLAAAISQVRQHQSAHEAHARSADGRPVPTRTRDFFARFGGLGAR